MSKKLTTKEFIKRAKEIHGNKYNYSKMKYVDSRTKIIITCKIHGDFPQTPTTHLGGAGCPDCAGNKQSDTEDFIKKAK
jgi:hypothetical protein